MNDLPAVRASDAERERTVERLRDASAEGRLTFEEFIERMTNAYEARTHAELEQLIGDLPDVSGGRVATRRPGAMVIGADSTLACEGELYDKPKTLAAARAQLTALGGRTHELVSSVVVAQNGAEIGRASCRERVFITV